MCSYKKISQNPSRNRRQALVILSHTKIPGYPVLKPKSDIEVSSNVLFENIMYSTYFKNVTFVTNKIRPITRKTLALFEPLVRNGSSIPKS